MKIMRHDCIPMVEGSGKRSRSGSGERKKAPSRTDSKKSATSRDGKGNSGFLCNISGYCYMLSYFYLSVFNCKPVSII